MERGWPSGPRLPRTVSAKRLGECFRCAETGERSIELARRLKRRHLHDAGVTVAGVLVGTALLCDSCLEALIPLNPDPLDVTTAA